MKEKNKMTDNEIRMSKVADEYIRQHYDDCYAWFDTESYNIFVYRKSDNELVDIFNIGEID